MAFEAPAANNRSDDVEVRDTVDERQGDKRTRQMGEEESEDPEGNDSSCSIGG